VSAAVWCLGKLRYVRLRCITGGGVWVCRATM
jgi:hypothetical protein